MTWLVIITMTASYQKIFSPNPRIGFLSYAATLTAQIAAGQISAAKLTDTHRVIFNQRLDAVVTTHRHGDHWQGLADVVKATGARTFARDNI